MFGPILKINNRWTPACPLAPTVLRHEHAGCPFHHEWHYSCQPRNLERHTKKVVWKCTQAFQFYSSVVINHYIYLSASMYNVHTKVYNTYGSPFSSPCFPVFFLGKTSRYTASSCTDLDNARFWIGSKKFWDARSLIIFTLAAGFWTIYTIFFISQIGHQYCFSAFKVSRGCYNEMESFLRVHSYFHTTVLS